jgi:hypothetical protein
MKKIQFSGNDGAFSIGIRQACNRAAKDSKESADSVNSVKDTTTTAATGIAVDEKDANLLQMLLMPAWPKLH